MTAMAFRLTVLSVIIYATHLAWAYHSESVSGGCWVAHRHFDGRAIIRRWECSPGCSITTCQKFPDGGEDCHYTCIAKRQPLVRRYVPPPPPSCSPGYYPVGEGKCCPSGSIYQNGRCAIPYVAPPPKPAEQFSQPSEWRNDASPLKTSENVKFLTLIVVGLVAVIGLLAKRDLPAQVRLIIGITVPALVSLALYTFGIKTDVTLLSIPVFAGLAIAVIYTIVG